MNLRYQKDGAMTDTAHQILILRNQSAIPYLLTQTEKTSCQLSWSNKSQWLEEFSYTSTMKLPAAIICIAFLCVASVAGIENFT